MCLCATTFCHIQDVSEKISFLEEEIIKIKAEIAREDSTQVFESKNSTRIVKKVLVPAVFKEWNAESPPVWFGDASFRRNHGDYETFLYQKVDPSGPNYLASNRGCENAAYFKFIIDHYDNFPDIAIFIHAWPFEHNPDLFNYVKCIRPNATYSSLNLGWYKCIDSWNGIWARHGMWTEQCMRDTMMAAWDLRTFEELEERVPITKPFHMCFYASQQFFISRDIIRKRSLESWKKMHSMLGEADVCHSGELDYEHLYSFNQSSRMKFGPETADFGMDAGRKKYGNSPGRLTQALTAEHLAELIYNGAQSLELAKPTVQSVCDQFLDVNQCPGSPCNISAVDLSHIPYRPVGGKNRRKRRKRKRR